MQRDILIAVILLLIVAGCGGRKTLADYELSLDSIVADTAVSLNKSQGKAQCSLHLNVKILQGPHTEMMNDSVLRGGVLPADYLSLTDEKLTPRQAVDSFIHRYVSDYRSFYGKVFDEEGDAGSAGLHYRVDTEVQMLRDGIIGYIAHISDQQGEQSLSYTRVQNLDAETGHPVHLSDLYDTDELQSLPQHIGMALASQLEFSDTIALREQGYFVHTPFYAPDNYQVVADGVEFIFVPGEIATRDKGEIRVKVE